MTAGIAAPRPAAVAMSASEMPGATTARLAEACWPVAWKAGMPPPTGPDRPAEGGERARARPARGAVGRRRPAALAEDLEKLERLPADAPELPGLFHDEGPAHDREEQEDDEDNLGDRPRVPDEGEDAGVQCVSGHGPSFGLRSAYPRIITRTWLPPSPSSSSCSLSARSCRPAARRPP